MEQKYEFEVWAEQCVRIRHKMTGQMVPFVLNRPQRRVLQVLEEQRQAGQPMRIIVLKARQWGCSTLIMLYMAWIQMTQRENWNSLICAHLKDTATLIRGMYKTLLDHYPDHLLPEGVKLANYEGMRDVKEIRGRGCRITACTSGSPDAARGGDYSMAHLSEVAFWADTKRRNPEDIVRSVCGSVPRQPMTVIAMESTANGVGNFFHREWVRACSGQSDKTPIFVPWYEIDIYREELCISREELWARLNDYERNLLEEYHLDWEQVNWYHQKSREYSTVQQMRAEYPTTQTEAFGSAQMPVFDADKVERLRRDTLPAPAHADFDRDLNVRPCESGQVEVWAEPCKEEERRVYTPYLVSVDIGGRWSGADYSVIAVFDCRTPGRMELVAQWRGHDDTDRVAMMAAQLGHRYHDALLVVESNSLECRGMDVLERLAAKGYRNLYRRKHNEKAGGGYEWRYGFHTNSTTKPAAINDLVAALREGTLVEHSAACVDEIANYVYHRNGTMAAAPGCHDDMLMTRAIALYALRQYPPRPRKAFPLT